MYDFTIERGKPRWSEFFFPHFPQVIPRWNKPKGVSQVFGSLFSVVGFKCRKYVHYEFGLYLNYINILMYGKKIYTFFKKAIFVQLATLSPVLLGKARHSKRVDLFFYYVIETNYQLRQLHLGADALMQLPQAQ